MDHIIIVSDSGVLRYIEGFWAGQLTNALQLLMEHARVMPKNTTPPRWQELDAEQAQKLFIQNAKNTISTNQLSAP